MSPNISSNLSPDSHETVLINPVNRKKSQTVSDEIDIITFTSEDKHDFSIEKKGVISDTKVKSYSEKSRKTSDASPLPDTANLDSSAKTKKTKHENESSTSYVIVKNQKIEKKISVQSARLLFQLIVVPILVPTLLLFVFYSEIGNEILFGFLLDPARNALPLSVKDLSSSVCVPGAGFSGFWFILGALQSTPDIQNKNYYCYSSACLGVAAALSNATVHDLRDIAFDVQNRWKRGDISRYQVVEEFVDGLMDQEVGGSSFEDPEILSKINIMLTTKGIGASARKPRTVAELRELLVLTTYIPFATGSELWKVDKSGQLHMDGAFSTRYHPQCQHNLKVPFDFDLLWNTLNTDLTRDSVEKFWVAGLTYGQ